MTLDLLPLQFKKYLVFIDTVVTRLPIVFSHYLHLVLYFGFQYLILACYYPWILL